MSFALGGATPSNNTLVYSGAKNATIIGKNGIASYWANTKYLYLSQLATYFLEILGQTKILANGNGIDITNSEANLRGINRTNKYNMLLVDSSNSPVNANYATDNLIVRFYGSGYHAVLPTITEVRNKLGITGTFAVRLTVVVYYISSGGTLWGRNSTLSGRNTSSYPQLKKNSGEDFYSIALGAGDIVDLLLVYDGSEYAAYELNRRT